MTEQICMKNYPGSRLWAVRLDSPGPTAVCYIMVHHATVTILHEAMQSLTSASIGLSVLSSNGNLGNAVADSQRDTRDTFDDGILVTPATQTAGLL